jgi:VWFA-related protein
MTLRNLTLLLAVVLCSALNSLQAQAQSTSQAPYTLQTDTRIVLTDVTVTDAKGNPVHGLQQSAFHIFDNNHPQALASFEEHNGIPAATVLPASTPGVYSNDYLLHLPPVLNIVLIDIANIGMADQMYLNYELTRFLNEKSDGQPLAIYLRAGSGTFLVQNFTSDRKLLLDAVHKAIPRFPPVGPREYLNDFDTLSQIAASLNQLPGRKNILWFSGGSTLYLFPDAVPLQSDAAWRALYDELDQERIALYPIDARGLTVGSGVGMMTQQGVMGEQAQATGGQAFYNSNGLKEITAYVLSSDSSFYTLTYSPHDLRFDNKWHKIRVAVDGGYRLSYRSGYFADGSVRDAHPPPQSRTRLMANGEKLDVMETSGHPIIFQARVLSVSDPSFASRGKALASLQLPLPKKGTVPYSIRYTVPIDAFTVKPVDGKYRIVFDVVALMLNRDGGLEGNDGVQVTMTLPEPIFHSSPDLPITLDQPINLAKNARYLYLGVWDATSHRFGIVQTQVEVPKASRQHDTAGGR